MDFSVVIPIYNSFLYISKTLDSVRKVANNKTYEVILIDDCSSDINNVKLLIESYPEVKLIEKNQKTNAAHSRNMGFELALSNFVFFLDSDDCFVGDAIERRIGIHKLEKVGVIFGNYITGFGDYNISSTLPSYKNEGFRNYLFFNGGDCRSSTISVCKEFHKGALFDEKSNKHQDWIFAILCSDNNEKISFDEMPTVLINVERLGRMSSSMNVKASSYFCHEYLDDKKHLNAFSKKHWVSMVYNKDKNACNFFFSIYSPLSFFEFVRFVFYKAIAHHSLIEYSSCLIFHLRKIKHGLRGG